MAQKICSLCKKNSADKMNSHIIPKFLCKGLFESIPARHTLYLHKIGNLQKRQDTPKEDNILCTSCEKRMEVIETYFGRFFQDIENYLNFPDKFFITNTNTIECNNVHPTLFKLFIYSLIWRASISSLSEFLNFKIPTLIEEEIRLFLDNSLKVNKSELLNSLENISVPKYHYHIIKPKEKSNGTFAIYNMATDVHLLVIVDFAVIFFSNNYSIDLKFKEVSNKQNEKVIITLGDRLTWENFNAKILNKMLANK